MEIIFETPRLLLRKFTADDALNLLQLNSDPEVTKYVHEPKLETIEQALQIINDIILPQYENNLGRWAIHTKENDEFIGWCGLKFLDTTKEIDIGYRFQKIFWGKGFATEAASHTLDYGFSKLHLDLITGKAHAQNAGSIKVLEKIGMKFVASNTEDGEPIKVFTICNPNIV